jgi:hypothetical protein
VQRVRAHRDRAQRHDRDPVAIAVLVDRIGGRRALDGHDHRLGAARDHDMHARLVVRDRIDPHRPADRLRKGERGGRTCGRRVAHAERVHVRASVGGATRSIVVVAARGEQQQAQDTRHESRHARDGRPGRNRRARTAVAFHGRAVTLPVHRRKLYASPLRRQRG